MLQKLSLVTHLGSAILYYAYSVMPIAEAAAYDEGLSELVVIY